MPQVHVSSLSNHTKLFKVSFSKLFLPIVLFLLVVLLMLRWGDQKMVLGKLGQVSPGIIGIALALSLLNYLVRFVRWQYFLGQIGLGKVIPGSLSLRTFLAGLGMAITPMRGGELIKSYLLKKESGVSFSSTAPLFFVERLTDAFAMLFLMSWGVLSFRLGWWIFASALTVCLIAVLLFQKTKLWPHLFRFLAILPVVKKYLDKASTFFASASRLTRVRVLVIGSLLATLAWFVQIVGGFLILGQVVPEHSSLSALFTVMFIFTFSAAVGFSIPLPGGIGVAEPSNIGLMLLLFALTRDQAVTVTLLARLTTLWFGTSIGLLTLLTFSGGRK